MTDRDQLQKLKKGVPEWNRWRKDNPDIPIDLAGADLRTYFLVGVDFSGADLSDVNLAKTQPGEADFSGADLRRADLREMVLGGSLFVGADLREARIRGAQLSFANFSMANLSEVDGRRTELRFANLQRANLTSAFFYEADLSSAKISNSYSRRVILTDANLQNADFSGSDLTDARLNSANLSGANLSGANLTDGELFRANLGSANLRQANFRRSDLSEADFTGADVRDADLEGASLVGTTLNGALLDGCRLYGISVWDVKLDDKTSQQNLVITPESQDTVRVDNLKVAQFIYLLLKNSELRHIIDTITSKVVLILGRFTEERKAVLDALRQELRRCDYTPVLFDFDKPTSRNLTETISTLAHMARFVIADITDAKSIPQELQKIVPNLPSLPVRPIILEDQYEWGMFIDFGSYQSVLPPYRYRDTEHLLASLKQEVIAPALNRSKEIDERRRAFEENLAKK